MTNDKQNIIAKFLLLLIVIGLIAILLNDEISDFERLKKQCDNYYGRYCNHEELKRFKEGK